MTNAEVTEFNRMNIITPVERNDIIHIIPAIFSPDLLAQIDFYTKDDNFDNTINNANIMMINSPTAINLEKNNKVNTINRIKTIVSYLKSINYQATEDAMVYIGIILEIILMYIAWFVNKIEKVTGSSNELMRGYDENKQFFSHYPCDVFIAIFTNPSLEALYMPYIVKPYYDQLKASLLGELPKEVVDQIISGY